MGYTFDVNADRDAAATVGEEALFRGQPGAALHMPGQFAVEQLQNLSGSSKLVLPPQRKFCIQKFSVFFKKTYFYLLILFSKYLFATFRSAMLSMRSIDRRKENLLQN